MNFFVLLSFIGVFSQIVPIILIPLDAYGQNTTSNTALTNGRSGITILDTLDNTKPQPFFTNVCIYESQIYSYGAVLNMAGVSKTCYGGPWQ